MPRIKGRVVVVIDTDDVDDDYNGDVLLAFLLI